MRTNPIIARCEELWKEGYTIVAVTIFMGAVRGTLDVRITLGNFAPLGEGCNTMRHHAVTVDLDNLPCGVSAQGLDRHDDELMQVAGNAEQAEALIVALAHYGQAQDWACFGTASEKRWLTKPNRWFQSRKDI